MSETEKPKPFVFNGFRTLEALESSLKESKGENWVYEVDVEQLGKVYFALPYSIAEFEKTLQKSAKKLFEQKSKK